MPLSMLVGCSTHLVRGSVTPDSEYYADDYRRGRVDVVCLQGMNSERGLPDTLFGCLLSARENALGVVDLPKGVYLGHVAEFIVRSLKFYEIEEHFERFHGYRIVLEFREASVAERKQGEFDDYSGMLLGAAGELALAGAGIASVPLSPVIFVFKSVRSDMKRAEIAEHAREKGLPEPTRHGGVAAFRDMRRSYETLARRAGRAAGVVDGDAILDTYIVERCYLERPGVDEILHIAGRLRNQE
jgi:hypothetical protein